MNNINFQQSVGFPLETDILNQMQTNWSIFNSLGAIVNSKAIISGCDIVGSNVSDGVVFLNGELLEFRGGVAQATVILKQDITSLEFEDGNSNEVIFTRYVTFGSATANQFNWADFVRPKTTHQLTQDKAEQTLIDTLITRIAALEARPIANVPIGMIAIWDRPDNEIPAGWEEYQEMRGRTPVGLDPDYDSNITGDLTNYNLDTLDYQGGKREHALTIAEMPTHSHDFAITAGTDAGGGAVATGTPNEAGGYYNLNNNGGGLKHTNMQPYRIVHFIKYVG